MSRTRDLLAIIKFRNLQLNDLLKGKPINHWAKEIRVHPNTLYNLRSMRLSAFKKRGGYTGVALKVSRYFHVEPEILFPESLYELHLPGTVQRSYSSEIILPMLEARRQKLLPEMTEATQDQEILRAEMERDVKEALQTLTPREQRFVELRFGLGDQSPHTLFECADEFYVSRERARQILSKALTKLRHPSRSLLRKWGE